MLSNETFSIVPSPPNEYGMHDGGKHEEWDAGGVPDLHNSVPPLKSRHHNQFHPENIDPNNEFIELDCYPARARVHKNPQRETLAILQASEGDHRD